LKIFLLTLVSIGILMLLMAIGVILTGKRLNGSCGGVFGLCICDITGRPRACEEDDVSEGSSAAPPDMVPLEALGRGLKASQTDDSVSSPKGLDDNTEPR